MLSSNGKILKNRLRFDKVTESLKVRTFLRLSVYKFYAVCCYVAGSRSTTGAGQGSSGNVIKHVVNFGELNVMSFVSPVCSSGSGLFYYVAEKSGNQGRVMLMQRLNISTGTLMTSSGL